MKNNSQSEVKSNVGMLRQWLNEDRITDPKKMVTDEDLEYWLKVAEPKLPPSEVKCCIGNCPKTCKIHGGWFVFCDNWGCLCHRRHHHKESPKSECCDGECNHDDCCGKIPENCTHHKESPVSQTVEGFISEIASQAMSVRDSGYCGACSLWPKLLKEQLPVLLSTLVKKMEEMYKITPEQIDFNVLRELDGFNAGISAAVETINAHI